MSGTAGAPFIKTNGRTLAEQLVVSLQMIPLSHTGRVYDFTNALPPAPKLIAQGFFSVL